MNNDNLNNDNEDNTAFMMNTTNKGEEIDQLDLHGDMLKDREQVKEKEQGVIREEEEQQLEQGDNCKRVNKKRNRENEKDLEAQEDIQQYERVTKEVKIEEEISEIIQSNIDFIPLYIKICDRRVQKIVEERDLLKKEVESLKLILLIKDEIGNNEESLRIQLELERENNEESRKNSLELATKYKSQIEMLTNLVTDLTRDLKNCQSSSSSSSSNGLNFNKTAQNTVQNKEVKTTPQQQQVTKKVATNQLTSFNLSQTNQSIKSVPPQKPQQVSIPLNTQKVQPPLAPKKSEIKNYKSRDIPSKTAIKKN